MAKAEVHNNPLAAKFKASTEALPAKDPKAAAIASLEAKCRQIVNLANDVREADNARSAAEQSVRVAKFADPESFDAALADYSQASVRFGTLRAQLYRLKSEIESDLEDYNLNHAFNIFVTHTPAGLPIRVNSSSHKSLWD